MLTITFITGFLYCAISISHKRKWNKLKQPWYVWFVGILGVSGQQILYVFSFKYAPPVQADLIIYTWPIMVVLFSFFIKKRKNFKRTLFATLLGFSGICLMLLSEENISVSLSSQQSLGYGLAFLCAIVWSLYTVISKTFQCPSEIVGFYGFVGAIFCAVLHFTLEETIMPNLLEWIVLFTMGIGITGFAYYCWDKGIKKGNFQLLSILSYINPILSITWLAIFGLGEVRLIILLSACMIIIGAFGGGITPKQWRFFRQGIQHLRVLLKLKDRRTTLAIIRQHKVHHADFDARKNKSISSFNLIKLKK